MEKNLCAPYEGDQPYLFVSYCHKDKDIVLPILELLQRNGIRIWYDAGIEPSSEWPEVIANHLDQSSFFLGFVSQASLDSHNCRKEFNFALMKNMPFLSVILEPAEFTPVMRLQMASVQAVRYYECSPEEFREKLLKIPSITICGNGWPERTVENHSGSDPACDANETSGKGNCAEKQAAVYHQEESQKKVLSAGVRPRRRIPLVIGSLALVALAVGIGMVMWHSGNSIQTAAHDGTNSAEVTLGPALESTNIPEKENSETAPVVETPRIQETERPSDSAVVPSEATTQPPVASNTPLPSSTPTPSPTPPTPSLTSVPAVTLNQSGLTINRGGRSTLTATGGTGTYTWSSSNPSVAQVNSGVVTALSDGTTVITVSSGGTSASCSISVKTVWSDWIDYLPSGITAQTESRILYRYRDNTRRTTESRSSSIDGWTQYDSFMHYGTWSDWRSSRISESSDIEVETRQVKTADGHTEYRYGRWYNSNGVVNWCAEYSEREGGTCTIQYSDWSTQQKSYEWNSIWTCGCTDAQHPRHTHVAYHSDDGRAWWIGYDGNWFWEESRWVDATYETQYRSREAYRLYSFYRWEKGTWSSWSETPYYSDGNNRDVETKTEYRYLIT